MTPGTVLTQVVLLVFIKLFGFIIDLNEQSFGCILTDHHKLNEECLRNSQLLRNCGDTNPSKTTIE